jgi:hypothetical protein
LPLGIFSSFGWRLAQAKAFPAARQIMNIQSLFHYQELGIALTASRLFYQVHGLAGQPSIQPDIQGLGRHFDQRMPELTRRHSLNAPDEWWHDYYGDVRVGDSVAAVALVVKPGKSRG